MDTEAHEHEESTMRYARILVLGTLLAAGVTSGACSDATGPEPVRDASGAWSGPFNHPAYDGGSLSMNLIDVRGTISGTYTLRLSRGSRDSGRVFVETSSGKVTGASGDGRLTLSLSRTDGEWILAGRFTGQNSASGDWLLGNVNGDFEIER
jgi:hypothetical protein